MIATFWNLSLDSSELKGGLGNSIHSFCETRAAQLHSKEGAERTLLAVGSRPMLGQDLASTTQKTGASVPAPGFLAHSPTTQRHAVIALSSPPWLPESL